MAARSAISSMAASSALDSITIEGFKSIASLKNLKLRPINLLIGANGSGKSNFIGVFSFLHAIREGQLKDYVTRSGGAEKLLHFGSKTTPELTVHLSFANKTNQYKLKLGATADDSLFPTIETAHYRPRFNEAVRETSLRQHQRGSEAGIHNPKLTGVPGWVRNLIGTWRVYHLHDTSSSSPMRKTAKIDDNQLLRPDGSNLAAFLYYLQEKHPEAYAMIRRTIQSVAPFFDDFQLMPLRLNPDDIKLEWRHKGSNQYFDASSLSDGTLRFIALATLLLQPKSHRPSIILVDEPELGLHPFAIGLLAALIRQVSVETQVIVSTQSALLLDHFEPEDVLVADRPGGGTSFKRLNREKLEAWLEEYSLGQLWEKNEFGGRPIRD